MCEGNPTSAQQGPNVPGKDQFTWVIKQIQSVEKPLTELNGGALRMF